MDNLSNDSILDTLIRYTQFNNSKFIKIDTSNYKSFFGDTPESFTESILTELSEKKLINLTKTSSSYILIVLEQAYKSRSDQIRSVRVSDLDLNAVENEGIEKNDTSESDEVFKMMKLIREMSVLSESLHQNEQFDSKIERISTMATDLMNLINQVKVNAEQD